MALYPSIAAAMSAQGYTSTSLGGGATYYSKPKASKAPTSYVPQTDSTGQVINPKYVSVSLGGQGGTWGGAKPPDYYLSGASAAGGSVTNPIAGVQSAINTAPPSNAAQMAAAAATGQNLAIAEAEQLNPQIASQFEAELLRANPAARELQSQMTANTQALLRGEIPQDVANLIRQYSAEQNVQGAHAAEARNLGLTSLELAATGFQQGAQLFDIGKKYLTAPTVDIATESARIREQLYGSQAITPAQAGGLALEAEQLSVNAELQNAQLAWARELSQLEMQREAEKDRMNALLYERSQEARAAEQAAKLGAFKSQVSGITSDAQASNAAYLSRLRSQTGGTRYLYPHQASAGYGYNMASIRNF